MSARPSPVSLPGEAGSPLFAPPKPHFGAGVGAVGGTAPPSGPGRPRRAAGRARTAPKPGEGDARGGMLAPIAPGRLSIRLSYLPQQYPCNASIPEAATSSTTGTVSHSFWGSLHFSLPSALFFFFPSWQHPNLQVPSSAGEQAEWHQATSATAVTSATSGFLPCCCRGVATVPQVS